MPKLGEACGGGGESSGNLKSLMPPSNLLSFGSNIIQINSSQKCRLNKTLKSAKSYFQSLFSLVSLTITQTVRSFTSEAVSIAIPSWREKSGPNISSIKKCKYPKFASLNLQYLKVAALDTAIWCYLLKNSAEDMKLLNTALLYLRTWKH